VVFSWCLAHGIHPSFSLLSHRYFHQSSELDISGKAEVCILLSNNHQSYVTCTVSF
jgi:hypothetical protein